MSDLYEYYILHSDNIWIVAPICKKAEEKFNIIGKSRITVNEEKAKSLVESTACLIEEYGKTYTDIDLVSRANKSGSCIFKGRRTAYIDMPVYLELIVSTETNKNSEHESISIKELEERVNERAKMFHSIKLNGIGEVTEFCYETPDETMSIVYRSIINLVNKHKSDEIAGEIHYEINRRTGNIRLTHLYGPIVSTLNNIYKGIYVNKISEDDIVIRYENSRYCVLKPMCDGERAIYEKM